MSRILAAMRGRPPSRGCVGTGKRYCRAPAGTRRLVAPHPVTASSVRHKHVKTARDQVSGTFMPQKVRIALDAMGGDAGASVVIPGAAISLSRHPGTEFLLFGDRAKIDPELDKHPALKKVSRVTHTDVAVGNH